MATDVVTYSTIEEVHAGLLEMLHVFDDFCKARGFSYYLGAGTLLGAVRHQGFIPWDDDVDLCMLRDEYEQLLRLPPEELPAGFYMHSSLSDENYYHPFAKFRKAGTEYIEAGHEGLDLDNTLWLDIFPIDNSEGPESLRRKARVVRVRALAEAQRRAALRHRGIKVEIDSPKSLFHDLIGYGSPSEIAARRDKAATLPTPADDNERWLIHYYGSYTEPGRYTDYFPLVELPFEDMELPAPHCYLDILAGAYGDDWMTPPPVEERHNHVS